MQLILMDSSLAFQSIFHANLRLNGSSISLRWSGSLGHGTSTISAHEWTMLLQAKEHSSASSGDACDFVSSPEGALAEEAPAAPCFFAWNESGPTESID